MAHRLALANIRFLEQGIALLASIDDRTYTRTDPALFRSGMGGHMRHCLEHYAQLLEGLDSGLVDYDARSRDRRVEHEREAAIARSREIIAGLAQLQSADAAQRLRIRSDCGDGHHREATCKDSSLGRELQFMLSHTTHHFALIAIILRLQGIEPGEDFGVASATLLHNRLALRV
jgi:uncharacterized damage-inducible protein DinB